MNGKKYLNFLINGGRFNFEEASDLCDKILEGELNDHEISGILSLLSSRPFAIDEILGFRNSIKQKGIKIDLEGFNAIDVCGTGGDGKHTFNISTASAFIIAACGYKVAKHGNYAVSSNFGSSDLIQSLGYEFKTDRDSLIKDLERANICFMHAPLFYSTLKKVAPIRKNLGIKTIFNALGPLLHPAEVSYQLTGVYSMNIFRAYSEILPTLLKKYYVVHSLDGHDEVSLTSSTMVSGVDLYAEIDPDRGVFRDMPIYRVKHENISVLGKDPKELFLNFLKGNANSDLNEVVAVNAALGIALYEHGNFLLAKEKAKEAIKSAKGYEVLKNLLGIK